MSAYIVCNSTISCPRRRLLRPLLQSVVLTICILVCVYLLQLIIQTNSSLVLNALIYSEIPCNDINKEVLKDSLRDFLRSTGVEQVNNNSKRNKNGDDGRSEIEETRLLREFLFKVLRVCKQNSQTETREKFVNRTVNVGDLHGSLKLLSDPSQYSTSLLNDAVTSLLQTVVTNFERTRKVPSYTKNKNQTFNLFSNSTDRETSVWKRFHNGITPFGLYSRKDDSMIDQLLSSLSRSPVSAVFEMTGAGSQVKFRFRFTDGSRAIFKPMRMERNFEESLDVFYFYETERHTAEIAAFHLDRLLGFRSVPPVAGRRIHMAVELQSAIQHSKHTTFYTSPAGNFCFQTKCLYYCGELFGICGSGDYLEGSFAALLPPRRLVSRLEFENPWKRSYSFSKKAPWENIDNGSKYCASVRRGAPFNDDAALLNLIDASIFDFLTGNKDRHHLYTFEQFGNGSFLILWDNGKGFGRARCDITDILAPLYQCCMVRFTTLRTLLEFHTSDRKLSDRMRSSLAKDALPDILTEAHLEALDRRVRIILEQIHNCTQNKSIHEVIIDDRYLLERD